MPAVDPARLARQVATLVEDFASPPDLAREGVHLLEFYSDRTRRARISSGPPGPAADLKVPAPVLRAIGAGLQKQAAAQPDHALAAAEALWQTGFRETSLLCAWILAPLPDPNVATWIESKAAQGGDPEAISALADRGLAGWRRADLDAYLEQAAAWVGAPQVALNSLGLKALRSALSAPGFEHLIRLFDALRRLPSPVRGEARLALQDLLSELAHRTPPETARFLLDELARGTPGTDRLIRALLEEFPSTFRDRLVQALSRN